MIVPFFITWHIRHAEIRANVRARQSFHLRCHALDCRGNFDVAVAFENAIMKERGECQKKGGFVDISSLSTTAFQRNARGSDSTSNPYGPLHPSLEQRIVKCTVSPDMMC